MKEGSRMAQYLLTDEQLNEVYALFARGNSVAGSGQFL